MTTKLAVFRLGEWRGLLRLVGTMAKKCWPRAPTREPVLLLVYLCNMIATLLCLRALYQGGHGARLLYALLPLGLWSGSWCANIAFALAQRRGLARAGDLRRRWCDRLVKKVVRPTRDAPYAQVRRSQLQVGDIVLVEAGEIIPADGEVVAGIAAVDESAVTQMGTPIVRLSGGATQAVLGGTQVIADWLLIRVNVAYGASCLDHLLTVLEGKGRQLTPDELAFIAAAANPDPAAFGRRGWVVVCSAATG